MPGSTFWTIGNFWNTIASLMPLACSLSASPKEANPREERADRKAYTRRSSDVPRLQPGGGEISGLAVFLDRDPKVHKFHKYKTSLKDPSGHPGGGLVPHWIYLGPIEPPNRAVFDHHGLYNSTSRGFSAPGRLLIPATIRPPQASGIVRFVVLTPNFFGLTFVNLLL